MNPDEPEADDNTPEEEEWQLYSTAGYAAAEDPWDDLVEVEDDKEEEEEWFDGDDFETNGQTLDWDSPPCPAPLGIAHKIRLGTCNHCLHRVGGRRTEEIGEKGGASLRAEAIARDKEL